MKRLIIDVDDTICYTKNSDYKNSSINIALVEKLKQYKDMGFEIILMTSRNMRTHSGNLGKINVNTLPILIEWLESNDIPYDELYMAKPWCGYDGFYIDDKAIRPSEFISMNFDEIHELLQKEKKCT